MDPHERATSVWYRVAGLLRRKSFAESKGGHVDNRAGQREHRGGTLRSCRPSRP